MMPDAVALAAFVILLLPMFYFFVTSPTFLLVKLDVENRSPGCCAAIFSGYFLVLSIAGVIGMVAFAVAGRLVHRHWHWS